MNNWTTSKLGNVASIITGPFGSQLHQSDYVDEGVPSIMPQNIGDRIVDFNGIAYISEQDANRLSRYRVKENDIVYSRRGDVEKHAIITDALSGALCGTGCLRVRFTNNDVLPEFISFYLNRPETKKWIRQHAVGSSMPNLNSGILADVPICYPHKATQVSIIAILKSIDRKIQLNNRIIAEHESMAKTIYDYWFAQFDFPNAEGRPYRASGGALVWNEQLKQEIPKGWDVTTLSTKGDFKNGINYDKDSIQERTVKIINVRDISSSSSVLLSETLDSISLEDDEISKYLVNKNDILIARSGIPGATRIMPPDTSETIYCGFIIRYRVADAISKPYLFFAIKQFEQASLSQSGGTILKNISQDTLKDTIVVMPDKMVLTAFDNQVNPILDLQYTKSRETYELVKLRDWLLPMLMNGQVTVK